MFSKKVGIHTGKVLCGIVGKRRFKFDVWSNDVTFANKMESSGKPGMVHISEKTYAFLKDQYFVLDGEDVGGKSNDCNVELRKLTYVLLFSIENKS